MANLVLCTCVFRIALPLLLGTCIIFRPSFISAIYLLLLLYSPMVPIPTTRTMAGHTGIYLKILIVITVITALLQIAFQIVLLGLSPYGSFLKNCEFLEEILRYAGLVRLDNADAITVTTWLAPEIIMILSSIVIYYFCYKLTSPNLEFSGEEGVEVRPKSKPQRNYTFWTALGKYIALASLCFAAVLRPSVQGGFYFLIFLSSATWWACYKDLQKGFAFLLRFVMVVVFLHIGTLYAYQFHFFQEILQSNSTYARYFGMTPIMTINCGEPRTFYWNDLEWASYANPIALLWLYYTLAIVSRHLLTPKSQKKQGTFSRLEGSFNGPLTRQMSHRLSDRRLVRSNTSRHRWQSATRKVRVDVRDHTFLSEFTPLIRRASPSRRYGSGSKKNANIFQDSTGSVTVAGETSEEIQMHALDDEDEKPGCFDNMLFVLEAFLQFIIQSSYVVTNIIMMTWSITYHSWITFILLLWANVLWMIPNQRRSMLKTSPFLVFYAWFLLISAYVYSMDLTEEELPSKIKEINLAQIGFQKITVLPCNPLLVKCLYTVMFWITLRQYMQERHEAKQTSALADMVAPLQVTVGTATGVNKSEDKENVGLKKVGAVLRSFLTKFWIWIVAITLFAVAITGERMTGFRILYMALFLFFIISFQLSFHMWRKLMFGFWLTVIIYSMIILIMVYTYQFDHFPEYWTTYLRVPHEQQLDIGLERYETKQLFVRLVTPTFFVIIAVIQLHYFHKDFMELSAPTEPTIQANPTTEEASSVQGDVLEHKTDDTDKTDASSSLKIDLTDIGNVSTNDIKRTFSLYMRKIRVFVNLVFLFLEIHMLKFVLLVLMFMCVFDKCALYFIIVIVFVLCAAAGRRIQLFSIYACSVYVSLLLLAKMVYQIQYIQHGYWNVTCEFNETSNVTDNNSEWLGFHKTVNGRELPHMVRWNIAYILAVTLYSVIMIRQHNYRSSKGLSLGRVFFMFPNVKWTDADKDLKSCLKYLANYGYYKFGVEICFMATVALIGFRLDLYAILYAIWLCVLFCMNRHALAKIWNFYLFFIAVFIPIQYIMVVGLPPSLCLDFPWYHSDLLRRIQDWAYLMDNSYPPSPKKLICDIILLLLVSRQAVAFRIETRYRNSDYPGGSNESIIHLMEEKNFVNPVPDYITYARSYLDIIKRGILLGFMWVTLAIVFLAGTNRVNIFSLGYLIGSFIFLWQGSDIYLKPIHKILRNWNFLLGYNVTVILMKAIFQLVGCIFANEVQEHACWLVQTLGIACVKKFGNVSQAAGIEDSQECTVPREYVGLAWDGVCFGFLLMQRRIFNSYNFFHIIDETKATTILASRGAELIELLRQKKMQEQDEQERRILEKIKHKMDRIKATQQKLQGPTYKTITSHYVDQPPLARSSSVSSCASTTSQQTPEAGYHTPIDEDDDLPPLTPAAGSLIQNQAPSPYSAIMTVSLEGYLEPHRMSFSSPPNSELNPRPPSPDDSFPVFSPPPYDAAPPYAEVVNEPPRAPQRQTSIGPPWMHGNLTTPRQSIISYSSRSPLSHHTYGLYPNTRPMFRRRQPKSYKEAIRSGDYYMFDELDDDDDLEMIEELQAHDEDDGEENGADSKRTLGQLLSSAMKTDIGTTLRISNSEIKRRASMPLARQRSTVSARSQLSAPLSAPPITKARKHHDHIVIRDQEEQIEPKPGTSKDEELSDISELRESKCQKFLDLLLFTWAFIDSLMVSIINYLNKYSKDYRYVIKVLTKEKKLLKESTDYSVGLRLGHNQIWQPAGSYQSLMNKSRATEVLPNSIISDCDEKRPLSECSESKAAVSSPLTCSPEKDRRKASVLTVPEIRILAPSLERGLDSPFPPGSPGNYTIPQYEDYDTGELSSYDQPSILRLLLAVWYIILCHSDILCYFVIFLNQIKSATLLSLPLPILVFLWGTITIPRPSKTFWVSVIAYTQLIVVVKCLFQFEIFPWNQVNTVLTTKVPKVIGIDRNKNYAVWDLFLLLIVFFHRYLLKCLGLWKTTIITPAVLSDGDYRLELEDVDAKKTDKTNLALPKNVRNSPNGRKGSDLQRLVEESEDTADEHHENSQEQDSKIVTIKTEETEPYEMFPDTLQMTTSKYADAIKLCFVQLLDPTSRVAADVYSYMFLCDFFNFFVILIGYSSFGSQQGDGGVSSYLEDDRVPIMFLLMLILQFLLIVIDRAIFLRKNILAKIIFQFIQIIILHIWLFVVFPVMTERDFNSVLPPQMYYMVKCFYLLLSAYQIRCGYPSRILGNFLCKGYNYVNMFLFKAFMIVPFLFELRTVMDWMWTDTSMTVFDWIKMEDIFAHIFQLKCTRHVENEYPQPRGERKSPTIKYIMGGGLLFIIIAIIWFPLVFFSLGNAVGEPNVPYDLTMDIRIGPYEPVYQLSAQSNSISSFHTQDMKQLTQLYLKNKIATTFISNYLAPDIAAIKLSGDSASVWSISPPDRERMIEEINSTKSLSVHLQYQVSHKSNNKEDSGVIREEVIITLESEKNGEPNPDRQNLLLMLLGDTPVSPVSLGYIMPKFIKVTNRGTAKPISQLMDEIPGTESSSRVMLNLQLSQSGAPMKKEWWQIQENCSDTNYLKYLQHVPYADCEHVMIYTFNDRIFPATLSIITAGGIIGLYTTLVFVASRIAKGFFSGICFKIMFEDMPNVDRVLQLCHDIYLVREVREFCLEEDLFAKLVFLFRSPETLIKWTRPKEEVEDEDNPEGEAE